MEGQKVIRDYLDAMIRLRGDPPKPRWISHEAFIRKHGKPYQGRKVPSRIGLLEIRQCFGNSQRLAILEGLTYVEGYAFNGIIPFLHGWCIDRHGKVVDATLRDAANAAYFGVAFQREYVRGVMLRTGYHSSLLDNYLERFPLLTGAHRTEDALEACHPDPRHRTRA